MNEWKIFSAMIITMFVMAIFLVAAPTVKAAVLDDKLEIIQFEINDVDVDFYEDSEVDQEFERGEKLEIVLNLKAVENVNDLEIQAFIAGDKYVKQRRDLTYDFATYRGTFSAGNAKKFKMYITIPEDLNVENSDKYKLRIVIADADSPGLFTKDFQLSIQGITSESAIKIDDFAFSPEQVVVGRAFTSLVRVRNLGDESIDDLKVTVSVPALNIRDIQYLDSDDEIDPDDYQTFEELLLRIPLDAKPGDYTVEIKVEFDRYYQVIAKGKITVVEEKSATASEDKSIITVTPAQEIAEGTSAIYPILIENTGNSAKTYTIAASGFGEWATYKLEPSSVVTVAGKSKETVLLTVTAKDNVAAGEKAFVITIDGPNEKVQKAVTATITSNGKSKTDWGKVQDGLTIGLIILVVILIILGLIIGFSKLRGSGDKDEETTQTYY